MARLPRFVLPGYPQHVIQRGNNRETIFGDEEDYWYYWEILVGGSKKHHCDVHAYVLMPDHIHLLVTPGQENGISKLMQYLGRYYVQYFNRKYQRTGTLWEGRYRATLVDPDEFLLSCSRYIELNPVRKGEADHPSRYPWSSYSYNARGGDDELVTPHEQYLKLGPDAPARQKAYRQLFRKRLNERTIEAIRQATNKAWLLGGPRFLSEIEPLLNRRAAPKPRGGDRRSASYRAMSRRAAASEA